jgi:hypothetical protein
MTTMGVPVVRDEEVQALLPNSAIEDHAHRVAGTAARARNVGVVLHDAPTAPAIAIAIVTQEQTSASTAS